MLKNKNLIIVSSTILAFAVACYFGFDYFKGNRPAEPVALIKQNHRVLPQKKIERQYAFKIHRYEHEFVFIDLLADLPDKIWVAGGTGIMEANFVEKVSDVVTVCNNNQNRILKKYELKEDFRMEPYVAFSRPDIQIERIEGEFEVKEFPVELIPWVKSDYLSKLPLPNDPHVEYETVDQLFSKCKFREKGEDLEIITCPSIELLLYKRSAVDIAEEGESLMNPFAYLKVGGKKYILSKDHAEDGSEKTFRIQNENDSDRIIVLEDNYDEVCDDSRPSHDGVEELEQE